MKIIGPFKGNKPCVGKKRNRKTSEEVISVVQVKTKGVLGRIGGVNENSGKPH